MVNVTENKTNLNVKKQNKKTECVDDIGKKITKNKIESIWSLKWSG